MSYRVMLHSLISMQLTPKYFYTLTEMTTENDDDDDDDGEIF